MGALPGSLAMQNTSSATPSAAVLALLSPNIEPTEARRCVDVLALDPAQPAWVVASSAREPVWSACSAELATPFGLGRATIKQGSDDGLPRAAGVGSAVAIERLAQSWQEALIAVRLTSPEYPRVRFADVGILGELVPFAERMAGHHDLEALQALSTDLQDLLETLVAQPSVRATAAALELHHSTVQDRLEQVNTLLGYDVRVPGGRFRLAVTVLALRVTQFRFAGAAGPRSL